MLRKRRQEISLFRKCADTAIDENNFEKVQIH